MNNPVFNNLSSWGRVFLLSGIVLIFAILFSFLGLLIGKFYLRMDIMQIAKALSYPEGKILTFAYFYQFLNQIGIFVLPPLFYGFLISKRPHSYFKLDKSPTAVAIVIITLSVYSVLPFLNFLADFNQNIHLPYYMKSMETWIREKEALAKELTEAFLNTKSISGLLLNLIVMAAIPAFGEELLFRGALQKIFVRMTNNSHLGIFITAFLFSAFHMQFLGFLPRLLLGIMLGYAVIITGSLWSAVWLHFVNNASSVIVYYLHHIGILKISMENFGNTNNIVYVIGSLIMTIWLFIMLYNREGGDIRLKYIDKD
jgi:membrane protease YdiL (CAAX protease family)